MRTRDAERFRAPSCRYSQVPPVGLRNEGPQIRILVEKREGAADH
jgi:hypothetical protein